MKRFLLIASCLVFSQFVIAAPSQTASNKSQVRLQVQLADETAAKNVKSIWVSFFDKDRYPIKTIAVYESEFNGKVLGDSEAAAFITIHGELLNPSSYKIEPKAQYDFLVEVRYSAFDEALRAAVLTLKSYSATLFERRQ